MKKLSQLLMCLMLFTAVAPSLAEAKGLKNDTDNTEISAEDQARLSEIDTRVAEIKEMDFSEMTKAEKKEIRNELKSLNKESKQLAGGVYISVGAIIIILLIILLLT
ncbi:seryl-tRNA synthetase [Anditalea andensis]|uniref:Seryl-tRNA synthetase n=1 Tax=Anditalea andensis TaxID=1048983 RepID=A0A074KXJ1_9BACT|nr:seryl-tRNA synthetase [Anditalea andensis]KEO73649.1 seryl-tRNA synthetase [Anditalea andensis]